MMLHIVSSFPQLGFVTSKHFLSISLSLSHPLVMMRVLLSLSILMYSLVVVVVLVVVGGLWSAV